MRKALCFFLLAFSIHAGAEDFAIQTFAGGGLPQNIQGTSATLQDPGGLATDAAGNVYFVVASFNIVLRLDTNGVLTLVAGNGTPGFSGDGGPAINAQLYQPTDLALDAAGDVFIVDYGNARIRMVRNGVITTLVGGGYYTADNIRAVDTQLSSPQNVAADAAGNVYVEDPYALLSAVTCCRIRKVTNGMITTIAGNGTQGYSGDGGPATSAQLDSPGAMATDGAGSLYFLDVTPASSINIRKIQNGVITTVAQGVNSGLLAVDTTGNLYVEGRGTIQEISNGVTTTIAGNPNPIVGGSIGDNGPATNADLGNLGGFSVDMKGNLFLASNPSVGNFPVIGGLIRKVSNGIIATVAGNATGAQPSIGDGGPPVDAQLFGSNSVAMDTAGNVYIAESNRIRKISQGVITTIVGTGIAGFTGDNGPAIDAQLRSPSGIALDATGNLYIVDQNRSLVRMVSTNGIITTIAGPGTFGNSGDGGPATSAWLSNVAGLAVSPGGDVYLSDADAVHPVIRKISNGIITTVAGGGINYNDPGPALSAQVHPAGLALDGAGNLYIADTYSGRIREVSNGIITTVTGSGFPFFSGDGGPAVSAQLNHPTAVAVDALGRIYEAETGRVRRIANGIINTIAGNGSSTFGTVVGNGPSGYAGDGGPATSAMVTPTSLAIGPNGQVYEAEAQTSRVRVLTPVPTPGVSFSANPAAIPTTAGSIAGQTTLTWNAPGYSSLQIFANGALFDDVGTSGSVTTGNWVSNGMNFSLVDPATGSPLSTVTVHTTAASSGGQVTFTASPSPITLAAGTSVGKTTLSWNAPGYSALQIWVDGVLFDAALPASGSVDTGNWVSDGTSFSLVGPASNHTIATLIVHTTTAPNGRVTFTANPNPIPLAAATNVGKTTLSWNAPGNGGLQIWVDGVLFDAALPASGSVETGNWVSDGTSFALVNPSSGQTLATVGVAAK